MAKTVDLSHSECINLSIALNFAHSSLALWQSGQVLGLNSKVCGFETYLRHCIVSLSETLYPLLSTGLTKEDRNCSQHD